jgi:GNAT superfamily N-acetyltransferase
MTGANLTRVSPVLTDARLPAIVRACRPIHSQSDKIVDVTDDRSRVDVEQLLELYRTTWWAHDRSLDLVRRALDHSHPVLTVWDGPTLIGFTRVISDLTFRATIWDVIVRPSHQGRGIGTQLMHAVLDHPDLKTVTTFFLLTRDKHSFYERLGFRHEPDKSMILRR